MRHSRYRWFAHKDSLIDEDCSRQCTELMHVHQLVGTVQWLVISGEVRVLDRSNNWHYGMVGRRRVPLVSLVT